ncbi:MAG TPA: NADP-dependent oxidoreductase [Chloroflexota bacterium]|nr:NADP-dependent oxidoreductase [Chloroflexota bacterium]
MKAVRYQEYGGPDVLEVVDVPDPSPGRGEVVVRVVTAGTNPGESAIRSGVMKEVFPADFPEGQGSDLAGVISSVGDGVEDMAVGDAVIGMSDSRNAHAEYALLSADQMTPKPEGLEWAVAGSLYVVGATAEVMMRAVRPEEGETVIVSGAAGGVGTLVTQLAMRAGARVIAVASEPNHEALRGWGAEPLSYGDGLEERIRSLAPDGVQALLDAYGGGYVELALGMGVPADRIETIIDYDAVQRHGVHGDGMSTLEDPRPVIARLAELLASGELELPIKARFPLEQVSDAYREVENRHGLGKIVLEVSAP